MIAFIQSEFIKLKHSKIFLLTVLGALTLPFLLYLSLISGNADGFESMLLACNQFTGSMFNIVLFAIVVSYILYSSFHSWWNYDTTVYRKSKRW